MSVVIPRGGRLHLAFTAGRYPAFERSPQAFLDLNTVTDADFQEAVHTGPERSAITVPVVAPERRGEWVSNPHPWRPLVTDDSTPPVDRPATVLPR